MFLHGNPLRVVSISTREKRIIVVRRNAKLVFHFLLTLSLLPPAGCAWSSSYKCSQVEPSAPSQIYLFLYILPQIFLQSKYLPHDDTASDEGEDLSWENIPFMSFLSPITASERANDDEASETCFGTKRIMSSYHIQWIQQTI